MNCREIEEMLSVYIDGELSPAEALTVVKHLSICNKCRQELLELQEIVNAIRNLPELEPPAHFHAKFCARLNSLKSRRPWYKRLSSKQWFPLGTVAAAVLLFVLALNVISPFTSIHESRMALKSTASTQVVNEADKQNNKEPYPPDRLAGEVMDSAASGGYMSAENKSEEELKVEERKEAEFSEQKTKQREQREEQEKTAAVTPFKVSDIEKSVRIMAKEFASGTGIQGPNNAAHALADSKNLNNRNGNFRERQETNKQAPAPEFKTAEVGATDSLAATWNVQLQVQDVGWVKSELEKLAYSQGGFLLYTDSGSMSLSIPHTRLEETLELLKKYGYPVMIENIGPNIPKQMADFQSKEEELSQKIKLLEKGLERMPDQQTKAKTEEELRSLRRELNYIQSTLKELTGGNVVLKIYLQN